MNKQIGKKISDFRKLNGLSQIDMAVKLGIAESTYQRIEYGDINSWINYLPKLCEIFNVKPEDIIISKDAFVQISYDSSTGGNQVTINHNSNIEQYETIIKEQKEIIELQKQLISDLKSVSTKP